MRSSNVDCTPAWGHNVFFYYSPHRVLTIEMLSKYISGNSSHRERESEDSRGK